MVIFSRKCLTPVNFDFQGGLPIVILRVGALGRYLILRLLHRTKFLTQRELDNVYIVEPLYYGWEYPTQMLVVSCFIWRRQSFKLRFISFYVS